jgi:hypothetical protein
MPIPSPSSTLVKAIESKSAVLIVGSGLSIPAGAPTWSALLEGIAAEAWETTPHDTQKVAVALAENDAGRPSSAAAILKGVLGAEFENVIARQFEERKTVTRNVAGIAAARAGDATATLFSVVRPAKRTLRPTATHKTLMKLPWRAVITTNYDRLLEGAAPHLPSLSWSSDSVSALVQRRDPFVFKLHGDVVHRGDIVLARDDYKRVVNHPPREERPARAARGRHRVLGGLRAQRRRPRPHARRARRGHGRERRLHRGEARRPHRARAALQGIEGVRRVARRLRRPPRVHRYARARGWRCACAEKGGCSRDTRCAEVHAPADHGGKGVVGEKVRSDSSCSAHRSHEGERSSAMDDHARCGARVRSAPCGAL